MSTKKLRSTTGLLPGEETPEGRAEMMGGSMYKEMGKKKSMPKGKKTKTKSKKKGPPVLPPNPGGPGYMMKPGKGMM